MFSTLEYYNEFSLHRKLTLDLLLSISDSRLSEAPISKAGTIGKQFRHLIDISKCYIDALENQKLVFERNDIDHSLEIDKPRLIIELKLTAERLKSFIESADPLEFSQEVIDCLESKKYVGVERTSPRIIVRWMIEHEIFHEGQLALYIRNFGMHFPESWVTWGLG
ncbi:MAG: DinB family protein [Thermoplasmatales archaeon]|nr:DinB family protein [Thermoplasmatales archaeon]MCW6169659.1 DinB family protein [Thermoplasmatales archaeon]